MGAEEYRVYRATDQKWGVQFKGRALALFPDKAQAIRAAVSIAHATATPDNPAVVLGEGEGGESYPIWTSGKDGFMPSVE